MNNFQNQNKTAIVIIASFFIILFIYTKLAGPIPFYINSTNTTKTDLFSASATGEVAAEPDQATLNAGVTKSALTVDEAQKQTNIVTNKLISDLKALGIKTTDIKTTNYSVSPKSSDGEVVMMPLRNIATSGYEVTQNLEINVKIPDVNKVTDLATKDGANLVNGVNFTFSTGLQKQLESEAMEMAVKDAKTKATALANAAGIRLGKIVNVVSSSTNGPVPYMIAAQKATDGQTQTNITPGENKVNIGITIYYETY